MENKTKIIFILSLSLIIIMSLSVSAYTKLCLSDCEGTPVNNPRYVCELGNKNRCNDVGYCEVCVTDSGNPTAPYRCAGQSCSFLDGGNDTSVVNESDLPVLIVNSPIDNTYYSSTGVYFDLEVDSDSLLEYKNVDDKRALWRTLCNDCTSYTGKVRLNEGLNHISFKATNSNGLSAEKELIIGVDSKKPRINGKTYPENRKYADGTFSVTYDEENVKNVTLYYGINNYTDIQLENCPSGKKQTCSIDVNLSDYEGQSLNYHFTVEDVTGRTVDSKRNTVKVDTVAPEITDLTYEIVEKTVTFDITTDSVARKITYIESGVSKEKTICSRTAHCIKNKTFKIGTYDLTVIAKDEAGNFDFREIQFIV